MNNERQTILSGGRSPADFAADFQRQKALKRCQPFETNPLDNHKNYLIHLMRISTLILSSFLLVASCGSSIEHKLSSQSASDLNPQNKLILLADSVVSAIASYDWSSLSKFVHAELGLRFSPYAYVDTSRDLVFFRDHLSTIASDTMIYNWGRYDGSGHPIELTFKDYYNRFIYNKNYQHGQRGEVNQILYNGNTIINILNVYGDRKVSFVEYHLPGTNEKYEGMDWGSLRLIFEHHKGQWYLIGIVHDQWTI